MVKSIKKRYKIIILLIAILMLIPAAGFFLIRLPAVQTFIVNRITSQIDDNLNTSISIGKVNFTFFNKLTMEDLLVLDNHSDTLLYAGEAKAGLRRIGISGKIIHLTRVSVRDPVFKIITDTTGVSNLNLYLSRIIKPVGERGPDKMIVRINHMEIYNGRFIIKNLNQSNEGEKGGVDFSDLELSELNAIIEDFSVKDDTTSMSLYRASFREKTGFEVDRFSSQFWVTGNAMEFTNAEIYTAGSSLSGESIALFFDEPEAFSNFIEDVRMRLSLRSSILSPHDIAFFLPALNIDPGPITVSGVISGTIAQLRGRNLYFEGGDLTSINFNFDFSGLPDIDNTYIFIDINDLNTRFSDLERMGLTETGKIPPDIDGKIGEMRFRGTFTGFTSDFVTYGTLFTSAGSLSTDISLRPSGKDEFRYKGTLQGNSIDAGSLSGYSEMLGKATFHLNIDGVMSSFKKFDAVLDGTINSVEINRYLYRDIQLSGNFTEKTWNGAINIRDENLVMDFIGLLDFQDTIPEFDFSLNIPLSNLHNLHIDKADTTSAFTVLMTANFQGSNIDNVAGEIRLLNSTVSRGGKTLEIYNGSMQTWTDNGTRAMDMNSDFGSIRLRGEYNFGTLSQSFRNLLSKLIPSAFSQFASVNLNGDNDFELEIELNETDNLNDFLGTEITVAPGSKIVLKYNEIERVTADAHFGSFTYKENEMTEMTVSFEVLDSLAELEIAAGELIIAGNMALEGFNIYLETKPDEARFYAGWENDEKTSTRGDVRFTTRFSGSDSLKLATISVEPTEIWIRNEMWRINPSTVSVRKKNITFNDVLINSSDDYYRLSGTISPDKTDTLHLEFEGINIGGLNYLVDLSDNDKLKFSVGGDLSGRIILTGILGEVMLETDDVVIENFRLIDHDYGNLYLKSVWDNNERLAHITLYNDLNGIRALDLNGYYDPGGKEIKMTAITNKLPINILNPLLSSFASDIGGYATGKVNLSGKLSQPLLTGSIFVENGKMKVDYIQTQYFFNDSVRFDSRGIVFNNILLADDRGNNSRLNGIIRHQNFRNYGIDLTFNANQMKVLDTRQKDNDIFYGTAFATGVIAIRGSEGNIGFDISARTDRNTRFFIPMSSTQSIEDYSFVTFTSSDIPLDESETESTRTARSDEGAISLNFDLDITPEAEVQLILDAKAGDVMRGRGSGKLNISLTPKGDFTMSGDYILSSGDYLFTLGNIVNKRFSVDEGSRLSWNGDISDADIDINARYRLEASLYDLLQDERFRERIPVECILELSGKLMNPVVVFDINLPTADEQTRSYLRNAINTDEELVRQFAYLLVMARFYPDPAFRTGSSATPTAGAGMSAIGNTMEMVSNQLTNWLSQISNDFDLGFAYRPGNEISAQEVEMAFSTQVLNDRVTINGNFDVGTGQTSSSATTVSGAFDVEVTITEKLKFKFFNRSNDNIFYETAPYTQGVGIFFRYEFDNFRNLFRRRSEAEGKKEEEPLPLEVN
ncbi:MAG: translocation/assembly module TamB domain-containing protein [Bacteroidales bacterium]